MPNRFDDKRNTLPRSEQAASDRTTSGTTTSREPTGSDHTVSGVEPLPSPQSHPVPIDWQARCQALEAQLQQNREALRQAHHQLAAFTEKVDHAPRDRPPIRPPLPQQTTQLLQQGQVLDQLALDMLLNQHSLQDNLRHIAMRASQLLAVERIGIWLTTEAASSIWLCHILLQRPHPVTEQPWPSPSTLTVPIPTGKQSHQPPPPATMAATTAQSNLAAGDRPSDRMTALAVDAAAEFVSEMKLDITHYPNYVAALRTERILAIADATTDPRMAEFQSDYIAARQICAMLEVPIWWQGELVGVVCFEQVGVRRDWSLADQSFARSIGNLVTLAIAQHHQITIAQTLHNREERWQLATAGTRDAMWDVDLLTQTTLKSDRWYEMLGYALDQIPEHESAWVDLIHPDDRDRVLATEAAYLRREIPDCEQEYRVRCADDSYKWIRSRAKAVWDDSGRPLRLVGANTDITPQKRAEAALQLIVKGTAAVVGQAFFQSLVKTLAEATGFEYAVVSEFCSIPGTSAKVLAFWSQHDGFGESFTYELRGTPCEQAIKTKRVCMYSQGVQTMFAEDDMLQTLPVEGYWGAPLVNSKGQVIGTMAVLSEQPMSEDAALQAILKIFAARAGAELERSQAEAKLRETSTQLHEAQQLAQLGRWSLQPDRSQPHQQQVELSPEFIAVWGLDPAALPHTYGELLTHVHADDRAEFSVQVDQAIARSTSSCFDHRVMGADGQERYLACRLQWHPPTSVLPARLIGTSLDMTERKHAELLAEQARQAADAANQAKSDFLANMSHELRTPLTAILGLSEVLQEQIFGELNDRQLTYVNTISESGNHLLELINDLLDLAKIEAGQLDLQHELIDIQLLCQSSLAFIQTQLQRKQIRLQFNVPSTLPQLWADRRRLRQVLINLLSNASKFTPERGTITLKAWGDRDIVYFSVADTGIGIPADQITDLFKPFVQLDSSFTRRHQGTGLGLAIVKQVVELHNGSVTVTSTVNQGSCFTIALPCNQSRPIATRPTVTSPAAAHDRATAPIWSTAQAPLILLAEDSEAIILTVQDYLQQHHCRVQVAQNGWEAIQLTKTCEPDLIIMDTQMPKLDGIQAMQAIRQDPRFQDVPIIALSSLVMPGDRDRCLAAGATLYLAKPVQLQRLLQVIQAQL